MVYVEVTWFMQVRWPTLNNGSNRLMTWLFGIKMSAIPSTQIWINYWQTITFFINWWFIETYRMCKHVGTIIKLISLMFSKAASPACNCGQFSFVLLILPLFLFWRWTLHFYFTGHRNVQDQRFSNWGPRHPSGPGRPERAGPQINDKNI